MFLHRPDRRVQFVGVTTDQPDYDEDFDTILHVARVAVQPPPSPVLFDVNLQLALFKVRPESRFELHSVEVEIDVQRSPQSLPPAELIDRSLVYKDKGQRRNVCVVLGRNGGRQNADLLPFVATNGRVMKKSHAAT